MTGLVQIALAVFVAIGLYLWRREYGLYSVIVAGVLQDVLRKADANQSIQFLVLSSLICLTVLSIFFFQRKRFSYSLIFNEGKIIYQVFCIYIIFIVFSSFWSYYNSLSLFMPALGFFIYLVPVLVIWLIYEMTDNLTFVVQLLKMYLVVQTMVAISIFFHWQGLLGNDFAFFIEVGEGVDIYDEVLENYIQGYNGFYRTPEVAAWHMGFAASLSIILLLIINNKFYQGLLIALALMFLFAGILTGRRKMIVIFAIFLIQIIWLLLKNKSLNRNISLIATFTLIIGLGVFLLIEINEVESNGLINYINRAISVTEASQTRGNLTFQALKDSISEAGFLGYGIGTYSPGARFGESSLPNQWSSEFGLSQIVLELGLLGVAILSLTYATMIKLFLTLRARIYQNNRISTLNACLFAILVTHVFGFAIASQVYADFYILILLAIMAGFQLSILKMNEKNEIKKLMILKALHS